jgi:hypothetical protein
MNEAGRHEWHLSLIRSLIAFVEQRDIQRDFRDPPSHLWTVAHESSLDADTSVRRSALFVEPSARQRVIGRGPGWPHGYDNGPAFVEHWGEDDRVREYLPTGNDEGLHPLVITQGFYGLKPDPAPRLIDEFVLFHNLWRDVENGHYFKLLDDGRTDPAAYSKTVACSCVRISYGSSRRLGSGISFSASIRAASGCRHRESTSRRSATMSCTISRTPAWWVESAIRLAPSHGSSG